MLQWSSGGKSERMKTPRHNHWWKPNTEQPCIENTQKLLFAFDFYKKTQEINVTVRAQTMSRPLHEKYSYLELFWPVSSRIRTRKTPYTDIFYAVESSIFSRIDYCNNLFIVLPQHQIRRMIKLQKYCARFAKCKFCLKMSYQSNGYTFFL